VVAVITKCKGILCFFNACNVASFPTPDGPDKTISNGSGFSKSKDTLSFSLIGPHQKFHDLLSIRKSNLNQDINKILVYPNYNG